MDYDILGALALAAAIFGGVKAYDLVTGKLKSRILGVVAFLAVAIPIFGAGASFSEIVLRRECSRSHDPAACVADQVED